MHSLFFSYILFITYILYLSSIQMTKPRPSYNLLCIFLSICMGTLAVADLEAPSHTVSYTSALSKTINDLQIYLNPKVEMKYSKEWGGNAYFAMQDIESHETLVSVPLENTIWYNSTNIQFSLEYLRQKGVLNIVQSIMSDYSRSLLLALLICVDMRNEDSLYYNTYYKLLPESYPHYILNWKDEEVKELDNTHAGVSAKYLRTLLNGYYDTLEERVPHFLEEMYITREKYRWAYGVVASRCYDVSVDQNGDNRVIRTMIPISDLFNHHPRAKIKSGYNPGTGRFHLVTVTPYRAGEQVFSNYGDRGSSSLLIVYGFAPPDPTPHEYAYLNLQLSRETQEYNLKKTVLHELGIELLELGRETIHDKVAFSLRLISMTKEEISSKNIADLLMGKILSISHERRTFQLLYETCDKKLSMFKTSISYDERVLEICLKYKFKFPCTQSENHINAIRARLVEKKIYNQWRSFSKRKVNELALL